MIAFLKQLKQREDGGAAIEFALIGPAFLTMFLGVLQVGIGMQNYNALRGISGDLARYAVINYQKSVKLKTTDLESQATSIATLPPYSLSSSRFVPSVTAVGTSRVTGALEYTITVKYRVRSLLGVMGMKDIQLTYSRPLFVVSS